MAVQPIPRVDILGTEVSAINMEIALAEIACWIDSREQHYVCVTGVHGVMESVRDPELRRIHNASGLTTPDGMPLVWCAHWSGARHVRRVYGPDLMLQLAAMAADKGWTSFFYGGNEGVPELLAETLTDRFPRFRTAGTHSPPFRDLTPEEDEAVIENINAAAPDLVWVGLSTPKQERWMASHFRKLNVPVLLGVGAAFDINADLIRQAPDWMQNSGLEWLFRLVTEPRRLWRRYLRNNPAFVARLLFRPPTLVETGVVKDTP